MGKSTRFKDKFKKNCETYFPIINGLMFMLGIFLLILLYQKCDAYDPPNRVSLFCAGIGFILFGVSKRFRLLSAGTLCLLMLILTLSVGFSDLWAGTVIFDINHLFGIITIILIFGTPAVFLLLKFFKTFRRFTPSMSSVDLMSGSEFEQFCADVLRKNGFYSVQVMGGSGDQGVDIVATKKKLRYAIQCKCYSSNLGNTPVQEVFAGRVHYGCDVAVVMTNRYFTTGAIELARSTGVLLWDRDWISKHLFKKKKQKKENGVLTVREIATVKAFQKSQPEPEPVHEIETVKSEKPLEEIFEKTKAERMAKLEEIGKEIRKKEEQKEKQEEYLKTIYGEEMKWRREQLHGGKEEDNQK